MPSSWAACAGPSGDKASAPATSRAEHIRRRTMDVLLLAAGRGPSLVRNSMAKTTAELKCRFALKSMPDGYGWGKARAANPAERWPVLLDPAWDQAGDWA